MDKKNILIIGLLVIGAIIMCQLLNLQIFSTEYKINAENNAYKYVTRYPASGVIYDRNNNILVTNKTTYDILVTPYEVQPFDTVALCRIFSLDIENVKKNFREYKQYRKKIGYQSMPFLKQVSSEKYNLFSERAFEFPGFSIQPRTARSYQIGEHTSELQSPDHLVCRL